MGRGHRRSSRAHEAAGATLSRSSNAGANLSSQQLLRLALAVVLAWRQGCVPFPAPSPWQLCGRPEPGVDRHAPTCLPPVSRVRCAFLSAGASEGVLHFSFLSHTCRVCASDTAGSRGSVQWALSQGAREAGEHLVHRSRLQQEFPACIRVLRILEVVSQGLWCWVRAFSGPKKQCFSVK